MRVVVCAWQHCDHPADFSVLARAGRPARRWLEGCAGAAVVARYGAYCLPHAVAVRRAVESRMAASVWFAPPPTLDPPLRLVGRGAGQRPLHRHVGPRVGRAR